MSKFTPPESAAITQSTGVPAQIHVSAAIFLMSMYPAAVDIAWDEPDLSLSGETVSVLCPRERNAAASLIIPSHR
jgi:hypothetical protein